MRNPKIEEIHPKGFAGIDGYTMQTLGMDGYFAHLERMKDAAMKLKLEVGKWYINRRGETITIRGQYEKTFRGYNFTTEESYWYFPDGSIAPMHNLRKADIVAETMPLKRITGRGITKSLAEELRERAAVYHSVELQVERIKEAARAAAERGETSMYLALFEYPISDVEKGYDLLISDGFTIDNHVLSWEKT